jgi:peptide/nickel transport system substrate-binding protein
LLSDQDAGDFQITQIGWSGRIDPDGNIHGFVTSEAGFNDGKYSNNKVDEVLNKARTVSSVEDRAPLYHEALAVMAKDRPLIYLYHLSWLYGIDDKVTGMTLYPDGMLRLEGVSIAN